MASRVLLAQATVDPAMVAHPKTIEQLLRDEAQAQMQPGEIIARVQVFLGKPIYVHDNETGSRIGPVVIALGRVTVVESDYAS